MALATVQGPCFFRSIMDTKEKAITDCINSFQQLLETRYHIVLGRKGKTIHISISFEIEDCFHLMGLQKFKDKKEERGKRKILMDILNDVEYRRAFASSPFYDNTIADRISCATKLSRIIEADGTVFQFSKGRLPFWSAIDAQFLLSNSSIDGKQIYLFLANRSSNDDRLVCKSIFHKEKKDYTVNQTIWTVLLKEKTTGDITTIIYRHKNYERT